MQGVCQVVDILTMSSMLITNRGQETLKELETLPVISIISIKTQTSFGVPNIYRNCCYSKK